MTIYEEIDSLLLNIIPDVFRTVKIVPTGNARPKEYAVWREINVDTEMASNNVYARQHIFSVGIFGASSVDDDAEKIIDLLVANGYTQSDQRDLDYDETTKYYGKYLEFYKIR